MLFLLGSPIQNPFSRGAIHSLNCLNGNVWNLWNNWNNTFDQRRRVVSTQSKPVRTRLTLLRWFDEALHGHVAQFETWVVRHAFANALEIVVAVDAEKLVPIKMV